MLDEKGVVAALKAAYKGGGYKAAFAEGKVMLRSGVWAAELDEEYILPRVVGTVVEHIGVLPSKPAAYYCQKKMDPGSGVPSTRSWMPGRRSTSNPKQPTRPSAGRGSCWMAARSGRPAPACGPGQWIPISPGSSTRKGSSWPSSVWRTEFQARRYSSRASRSGP